VIAGLSVLALIPARGGSKGLPGKNIRPAGGRPLIHYTIDAARAARTVDRVVLSSNDDAIIEAARTAGCEVPFKRPPPLATDEATSIDVVLHALDALPRHDLVVLLQPTSPLRSAADIDAACTRLVECDAPSCVSVTLAEHSPYWMYSLVPGHRMKPLLPLPPGSRRQDLPPAWRLNGAVYVARTDWLRRTRAFVGTDSVALEMPAERSLDIDTLDDFEHFTRMLSGASR
jgi:CMP-N,N'-diacetyllegionaminic acid synthase